MTTVVSIIGARPQFVKAAVVSRAMRRNRSLREIIIHTGQHYDKDMSGRFFEELGIPKPDYNLGVGSDRHGRQTGIMLGLIEEILLNVKPDWTLVYGDTNSTLAGALAAAKLGIPIAHVEAGLRSFNRRMPEEINRVLTDHISDLLFAPTRSAVANLVVEGFHLSAVALVGDVMCDAARHYAAKAARMNTVRKKLNLRRKKYVLATIHRAENTDAPARLRVILDGLSLTAKEMPVVMPLHPRTRLAMQKAGWKAPAGARVLQPLGYLDMIDMEQNAAVIATDSGGVQKEAYLHGVPCVTLRHETEWTELLRTKWNRLCPPENSERIAQTILGAIGTKGKKVNLYGTGHAAEKIAATLAGRPG